VLAQRIERIRDIACIHWRIQKARGGGGHRPSLLVIFFRQVAFFSRIKRV